MWHIRHIIREQSKVVNKISNTELLERSDMSNIKLTIKQRKWRWLGHTLRKAQDDITNQSLKWNPKGVRWIDQNPPGRENSKMNLKRRSKKLSVKPQQLQLPT